MILRIVHLMSLLILVGSAVAVYKVKYESTYDAQRIAKIRNEIRVERERVATLKAEWTRLASPQRIQDLAERHLGMKPLEVARISDLSGLPEKPPSANDGDTIGEFIETLGGAEARGDALGEFLRSINGERAAEGRQ